MSNHGDKWIHLARIIEINKVTLSTVIKWDASLCKDTVDLAIVKYMIMDNEDISNRKHKATDFNQNSPVKKSKFSKSQKSDASLEPPPGQMCSTQPSLCR